MYVHVRLYTYRSTDIYYSYEDWILSVLIKVLPRPEYKSNGMYMY